MHVELRVSKALFAWTGIQDLELFVMSDWSTAATKMIFGKHEALDPVHFNFVAGNTELKDTDIIGEHLFKMLPTTPALLKLHLRAGSQELRRRGPACANPLIRLPCRVRRLRMAYSCACLAWRAHACLFESSWAHRHVAHLIAVLKNHDVCCAAHRMATR
jgi:hypothetical protein